jgi:pimeloyl-ACP methyl ester carboxylesterase
MSATPISSRSFVSTSLGEVAYSEAGSGPAALFVHGVFLNADLWRNVIPKLQDERRCIALDLPAHGRTRTDDRAFSLTAQADLIESLCKSLGLDDGIDLVGNDTGGAVAQVFAARHPMRLRTLTLTNCDAHDNLPPPAFEQAVELAAQGALAPVVAGMASDPELARSDTGLGVGYEHPERLSTEEIRAYLERFATPDGAQELERYITSLDVDDLLAAEPGLARLDVPTLIVWGTGDVFFDVSWAYWLRDLIPGASEVVEIDGAKLFFPDERADELAVCLRRHWARHSARQAATH